MNFRACLHGVGDPGLVGLVSFVFTLWGHKTKETYPTKPGSPTPCKQGLRGGCFCGGFCYHFSENYFVNLEIAEQSDFGSKLRCYSCNLITLLF